MDLQPTLQKRKSLRFATTLNFVLPGAGQFYLGQHVLGGILVLSFLTCLLAALLIFLHGYATYLQAVTSGDIFEPGILEQLSTTFHVWWLIGLLIASLIIFLVAMIALALAAKKEDTHENPAH